MGKKLEIGENFGAGAFNSGNSGEGPHYEHNRFSAYSEPKELSRKEIMDMGAASPGYPDLDEEIKKNKKL
jgi:hypothetical protein